MARKYFSILTPLFVLLWVAGTNHCALEYFFSTNASTNVGDCESHSDKSSESHKEGQPCTTKSLLASGEQLAKAKIVADEPTFVYFVFASNFVFAEQRESTTIRLANDLTADLYPQPLISLSIASNAPPVSA